ncbi:hypothetical protein DC31_16025 [Microbacterium sp. CH12i]|nr:hypothetical protein DC31_16025 [Microbacterium sp. CH12i]
MRAMPPPSGPSRSTTHRTSRHHQSTTAALRTIRSRRACHSPLIRTARIRRPIGPSHGSPE